MTKCDLVEKLMEMRQAAKPRHLTAMTQLFGIIFHEDIGKGGSNATQIAGKAGTKQQRWKSTPAASWRATCT